MAEAHPHDHAHAPHAPGSEASAAGGPERVPHGHAGHAHTGPAHDDAHDEQEAFPRRLLATLVADDEGASRARARWQAVFLAFGLAILALAFPTRALIGDGPDFVRACDGGAWFVVHLALAPLARIVAWLPWLGIEQAWFVLSAACWSVCAIASWKSLVRYGARARAALIAACVTLGAPAAWLAATLPGGAAPGLLGAWLVFGSLLDAAREPERAARHKKVALAFGLALLLDVRALAYLPAIVAEAWSTGRERGEARRRVELRAVAVLAPLGLLAAAFALVAFALPSDPSGGAFLGRAFDVLTGRGPGGIGSLWLALFGLGTAAFGLLVLVLRPVDAEEARPPVWIAVWCVGPLVLPILTWNIDAKAVLVALLPPAALGLASWFANREWKELVRYAVLFVAGQFAIGFGFSRGIAGMDRNATWKDRALVELVPGDVLVALHPDHVYLARHRFGLEAVDLAEPLALDGTERAQWWRELETRLGAELDGGGRIVIDLGDVPSGYACRSELLALAAALPHAEL